MGVHARCIHEDSVHALDSRSLTLNMDAPTKLEVNIPIELYDILSLLC